MLYRRNLPHWHPEGKALFVTWRLYGSLPMGSVSSSDGRPGLSAGQKFRAVDRLLDQAGSGPLYLKDPRIARHIVRTLRRGEIELRQYTLYAFVVMANHVHVLLQPRVPMRRITNGVKGVTARVANQILGRTGQPFWQDESFDRWVRNEAEFERIRSYIERNPVAAGLVKKPEDWPWSSASLDHAGRGREG